MKKIFHILIFLVLAFTVRAQIPADSSYPAKQSVANTPTTILLSNAIKVSDGFINSIFQDTATANLFAQGGKIKFYPLSVIGTYNPSANDSGTVWLRNGSATKWLRGSGSIDITSFTFDNDTTGIICFSNGVCDTFTINNLFNIVTNIVNNFNDSSIYNFNDSTLIICHGEGVARVCDTIHLGNSNTYYYLNDSTLITCDTLETICVGDSCYTQQLCDTIPVTPLVTLQFQNGQYKLPNSKIVEDYDVGGNQAQLLHNSILNTVGSNLLYRGTPTAHEPFGVSQGQISGLSSSIMSFNHAGGNIYTYPGMIDNENVVNLYVNYTDRFVTGVGAPFTGDTLGFMYDRIGYMIMGNSRGGSNAYVIDNALSKQAGIMIHTLDTTYTDAVTIFGKQTPSAFAFPVNPYPTTTLLDYRIAVFKTDGTVQFPDYITTNNRVSDSTNYKPLVVDASGNMYRSFWFGSGGGSNTDSLFARQDNFNNSGGALYFDNDAENFQIDNIGAMTFNGTAFGYSDYATSQGRIGADATHTIFNSPDGNQFIEIGNTFNIWSASNGAYIHISQNEGGGNLTDFSMDDGTYSISGSSTNLTSSVIHNDVSGALTLSSDKKVTLSATTGIYASTIPYNSGAGIVALGIDTVALSPTFGQIVRKTASSSGGITTADNGLTANTSTNVQLGSTSNSGSPLLHDTWINTTANYSLKVNGSIPSSTGDGIVFEVINSSSDGYAIYGQAVNAYGVWGYSSGGVGVYGNGGDGGMYATGANFGIQATASGSGTGVSANSSSGIGISSVSTTGLALTEFVNPATTNSVYEIERIQRGTSGTAADGIGVSTGYYVEATDGTAYLVNQLISKLPTANTATRTSQFDITGVNSATTETFANFQTGGIVRVNNLADTLATKAYARSVGGGSGSSTWNGITDPTGNQTLAWDDAEVNTWTNGSNTETWFTRNNNSLTTGIGELSQTSSITTGNLVSLVSTSTAANAFSLLNINSSGANANSSRQAIGQLISVTNTGTSSTNTGLKITASGASTNNAVEVTAGTVVLPTGSSTVRSIDMGNIGIYNSAGSDLGIFAGTIARAFVGQSGFVVRDGSSALIDLGNSGSLGGTNYWRLNGFAVGTMQLGMETTQQAMTFKAKNNAGTDQNGFLFTIQSSAGTGTGIPAGLDFQTSVPTTTGTTVQSFGDRFQLVGKYTTLTEATATAFVRVNIPSGTVAGGTIVVTVEANDATDFQSRTLRFIWTASNKGGTTTITISTPEEVAAVSTGTLTATITAVDSGSGNVDFKADATSSLTQTVLRANCQVTKNFGVGSITAQ